MPKGSNASAHSKKTVIEVKSSPIKTVPVSLMFLPRRNDYSNEANIEAKKNLVKDFSDFIPTKAPCFGGSKTLGAHTTKKTANREPQRFYLSHHTPKEYLANEVLLRIGIHTPKVRFAVKARKEVIVASHALEGYIPMAGVRHDVHFAKEHCVASFRERYQLDIEKQVVIDLKENKAEYKINGNLFGSDIAALLIGDDDFHPNLFNLGLIRSGNRLIASAIDKECVSFSGEDYETLSKKVAVVLEDKLYATKKLDQTLVVLNKIARALVEDENKICDFDRIFNNPRVTSSHTIFSATECKKDCDNLKKSANSILQHYTVLLGKDFLIKFRQREKIRNEIAAKIVKVIQLPNHIDGAWLKRTITEDLRAPYYETFFTDQVTKQISEADLKNEKLIAAMRADICKEFELSLLQKRPASRAT